MTSEELKQSIELLAKRIQETVTSHMDGVPDDVPRVTVMAIAMTALRINEKAIMDAYAVTI